jgi:chromosome segregation ATPase
VAALVAFMAQLDRLRQEVDAKQGKEKPKDLETMDAVLGQQRDWQNRAVTEINTLQENIKSFNVEDMATFDTVTKMRGEISSLRSELASQEKLVGDLNHDIKLMDGLSVESQRALGLTQNEMSNVTEELAKIYHHICTANNITPSRVMLEHSKGED